MFVFLVFTMGASGLAKAVASHNSINTQTEAISQINTSDQKSLTKCCLVKEEQSDTQSPRCIGDICIQVPSTKPTPLGFGNKLPMITSAYIGMDIQTSFLRPPIS